MFHKSSNYWETQPWLDSSWQSLGFPRKSCCDSRFLHLHQFLSGNFLACSLIWTFTSRSSVLSSLLPPACLSEARLSLRLHFSMATSLGFAPDTCLPASKVLNYIHYLRGTFTYNSFKYAQAQKKVFSISLSFIAIFYFISLCCWMDFVCSYFPSGWFTAAFSVF